MKNFKKVLALVLVVASLLSLATVASAKDYTDVNSDSQYVEAIDVLSYLKVLEGYEDGSFKSEGKITREEAAKVIAMFDNGSTDISTLYTSANPFADVKGRWSESYVGYCYRMGIVKGPRPNMYDPKENVTGVEFLKMALTTLDYNAEKEGFVGTSWQTNVLALARELDLLEGLPATFAPGADLTRGEAAQILFNTMKQEYVEYGNTLRITGASKNEDNGHVHVTVAGAFCTGVTMAEKAWGLKKQIVFDEFERPCYQWYDTKADKTVAQWLFPVVAEHTALVNGCEVLCDCGVDKTSTKSIYYAYFLNGENKTIPHGDNKMYHYYQTVDGVCYAEDFFWFGGQGSLTQIFKVTKADLLAADQARFANFFGDQKSIYFITSIDTWLGKVTKASETVLRKDGHVKYNQALEFKVFSAIDYDKNNNPIDNTNQFCIGVQADHCISTTLGTNDPTGFAKNDYVLFTYSFKIANANKAWPDCNEGVQTMKVTESKAGKLTGFTDLTLGYKNRATVTKIDDVNVADSKHFHLGYDTSKTVANMSKTFNFFYDFYGNVIGCTEEAGSSAKNYTVIDALWNHAHKTLTAYADLVFMDAKLTEENVIKSLQTPGKAAVDLEMLEPLAAKQDAMFRDHLYTYTVSSDKYTLTRPDVQTIENARIVAGDPNVYEVADKGPEAGKIGKSKVPTNEKTQYLFRTGDHTYVAFTNYKEVKSCTLSKVEYIMDSNNTYATVVYGVLTSYNGVGSKAFVVFPEIRDTILIGSCKYFVYKAFVNGVETTLYTDATKDQYEIWGPFFEGKHNEKFKYPGLVYLSFVEDENGVVVVDAKKVEAKTWQVGLVKECSETALVLEAGKKHEIEAQLAEKFGYNFKFEVLDLDGKALNITDIPVYVFDAAYSLNVTAGETKNVAEGEVVFFQIKDNAPGAKEITGSDIEAIYVFDFEE